MRLPLLGTLIAWPAAAQQAGKAWRVSYLTFEPQSLSPTYAVTLARRRS